MSATRRMRRASAVMMVIVGMALMLLAPEIWLGALLFAVGVVIELVGIALERKSN